MVKKNQKPSTYEKKMTITMNEIKKIEDLCLLIGKGNVLYLTRG